MYFACLQNQAPAQPVENAPVPRYRPPQPPPRFIPDFCQNEEMLTPEILRNHLHHCIYVWLISGHEFWMFPTAFDNEVMEGYIWDANGWTRYAFDPRLLKGLY